MKKTLRKKISKIVLDKSLAEGVHSFGEFCLHLARNIEHDFETPLQALPNLVGADILKAIGGGMAGIAFSGCLLQVCRLRYRFQP